MTVNPAAYENSLEVEGMSAALATLVERIEKHPDYNTDEYRDEDILKRIISARGFNMDHAYQQWEGWAQWHTQYRPESITQEKIQRQLDSGKAKLGGKDKFGRPCIVVRPTLHIPDPENPQEVLDFTVFMLETSTKIARAHGDGYVCVIWEHTGTGYKNFDTALLLGKPGFLSILKDYYPERLACLYFVNLNFLFRVFLKVVLPFLDERMKKKLIMLDSEEDLLQYFEPEGLPEAYRERLCPAEN